MVIHRRGFFFPGLSGVLCNLADWRLLGRSSLLTLLHLNPPHIPVASEKGTAAGSAQSSLHGGDPMRRAVKPISHFSRVAKSG